MRVLVQASLPHGLIIPRRLAIIALGLWGMLAADSTSAAEAPPPTRGVHDLAIGLFDLTDGKERPVEFALKASAREPAGYNRLASVPVTAGPPPDR